MTNRGVFEHPSIDTFLDVLSSRYRRRLLVSLLETAPGEAPLVPEDLVGDDEPTEQVRIRLRHIDLPKLADEELIEWDRTEGVVSRGPRFAEIAPVLALFLKQDGETPEEGI